MSRFFPLFLPVFLLTACDSKENDFIDAETKRRIQLNPLVSLSETTEEVPSAALAMQFLRLLEKKDSNLAMNLKSCAAEEYQGDQGSCDNNGYGDMECAIKKGFWKGTLAKHLRFTRIDLNNDQKSDFILTGDNCSGFVGSPAYQYFVVLSDRVGMHVAAQLTATSVDVMPETVGDGKIIVEWLSTYNGDSPTIWKLSKGRYVMDQCMWRSRTESDNKSEFHRVPCQPETTTGK